MNEKPKRIKLTPEEKANRNRGYRMTGIEKAGIVALLESGKGVRQVARETGRTPSTISRISRGKCVPIEPEQVAHIKMNLSGKLYKRADESVDLMGDGRLEDMSAYQLAGITKHTVETARLLDNESTANIGIAGQINHLIGNPDDLRQVLSTLADSRKARFLGDLGSTDGET
jgi:hypothetical protein